MSEAPDEDLTPEQEELAQQFAAELEGVSGIDMTTDEDGQLWLNLGDMGAPITEEQAATLHAAIYETALARVVAMRPEVKKTHPSARVAGWAFSVAFSSVLLAGAFALAKAVLGL